MIPDDEFMPRQVDSLRGYLINQTLCRFRELALILESVSDEFMLRGNQNDV